MSADSNVIAVRPEQPQDEAFLFELYASTRQEELDAWGWPAETRSTFLAIQFKASQGYHTAFPDAEFQIVLLDGTKAGRLIIDRTAEELHLVDIALLPQYRNTGIGSALLRKIFGEAAATNKPLRLKMLKGNRAERFYQRLGFQKTGETELRFELEWRAPMAAAAKPILPDTVKMPLLYDTARLQSDLARMVADEFVPHFNQAYYEGDWSAIPLRSVGGRADSIYPDPSAKNAFADTPLLGRCPYIREVLATLHCPLQAVRFLRLKSGSVIKEHRDHELGFEDGEVRLHVPVITNPEVEFMLNQVRVIMNEGECWYLNVNKPHRVANRGAADRVHLVVDCVVNDWLRNLLLAAAESAGQTPPCA
ncbi:MAG TPA: GNAT family N-acetyltransferase [Verrucomicrobiae bacterium]|jgi:GNAT superfamily N-acetyltransferase|nr:GNAT family N-acetyltransferase [Verrucomicrobiae bacterium]